MLAGRLVFEQDGVNKPFLSVMQQGALSIGKFLSLLFGKNITFTSAYKGRKLLY
jgi:hypothetical protein